MEMGKGETSASQEIVNRADVVAMLERLGLKENDLDDVVFEEDT
jgi:hypothetical protein